MSERKKLWVVTYNFHPVWAGPAERFLRYYDGLTARGLDVEYITALREGTEESEKVRGAQVRRLGNKNTTPDIRSFVEMACNLAHKERPDCFLLLLGDIFNSRSIKKLSKAGIKTVFVNTMMYIPSKSRNPLRRIASYYYNRWFFEAFDTVVCSTQVLKKAVVSLGVSENKIEIISNGVDLTRFKPLDSEDDVTALREELGLPLKEKIALFVGLRVERKGVLDLIEAWKLYKSNDGQGYLALVGGEKRDNPHFYNFYKEWDRVVEKITPEDCVLLIPPSKKIEKFFQACDFFVFLSKKEGMPNVLTEAMAAGCPLITTQFEGFSETWGYDKKELLIVERSSEKIKRALKSMMSDELLFNTIKENALNHIVKNHNVESTLDKYVRITTL